MVEQGFVSTLKCWNNDYPGNPKAQKQREGGEANIRFDTNTKKLWEGLLEFQGAIILGV